MPAVFHYREPISPTVEKQADGKFALRRIPIFECHQREDIRCDEKWMEACVADQKAKRLKGFKPRLIIGHTGDRPSDPEKPVEAFLDNYYFDPSSRWLFADYVDVPAGLLADLKANKWPGRSAEASRSKPAIDCVALLGGTPPYFKLPDLKYGEEDTISIFTELQMATPKKLTEENTRKLYADYCKYMGMEAPAAGTAPNAAQEADYQKFCQLMQRYEAENGGSAKQEPTEEEDPTKKAPPQAAPYSEPTKKEPAVADDTAKYAELVERIDKLAAENHRLSEENQRADWTQKYSEARIPRGRIDVKEEVGFLMELPEDKRQAYFDRSIKQIAGPSTEPVKQEEAGPLTAGTEREATEIKKYYESNRKKYRGDYAAATRDFRNGARIAEAK